MNSHPSHGVHSLAREVDIKKITKPITKVSGVLKGIYNVLLEYKTERTILVLDTEKNTAYNNVISGYPSRKIILWRY